MGQESERDDLTETRTTAKAEAARRDEAERVQAEHPERVAGRGRESADARKEGDARDEGEGRG